MWSRTFVNSETSVISAAVPITPFVGSDGNPMTVKVASAVNEITAAYNVDQLELTLKIPSD